MSPSPSCFPLSWYDNQKTVNQLCLHVFSDRVEHSKWTLEMNFDQLNKKRFPLKGTKHLAGAKVRATVLLSECSQTYTLEARVILESAVCPCMKRDLSSLDTLSTKQILLLNWLSLKHTEHCRALCISFKWRYFETDNYYLNILMTNTLLCSVYNAKRTMFIKKNI